MIFRDLQRSFRVLLKRPQFAAVAVLAMALGIGANTALFSIVDSVLLLPLPFPDSSRLVAFWLQDLRNDDMNFHPAAVAEIRSQSHRMMSGLGVYGLIPRSWTLSGQSTVITCGVVSRGFLEALGVRPVLGRFFTPQEYQPGRGNVVVLSHRLWLAGYDASPKVLGQTMMLNGAPFTIVGVAPPGLHFLGLRYEGYIGAWLPSSLKTARLDQYIMLARLRPGVSLSEAKAELETIAGRMAAQNPARYKGYSFSVHPIRQMLTEDVRPALLLLLGATFLILLIAVVNVANLLLVRGRQRAKEVAVEIALGATRGRVIFQWMMESSVLALAGAAAGLLLALAGLNLFQHFATSTLLRMPAPHLSWQMIAFCIGVASVAGIAVGIVPAIQASRLDPNAVLHAGEASGRAGGSRELRRAMRGLMVAEIALAFSVAAGSLLLVRSFTNLTAVRTGMRVRHVLTLRVYVPTGVFKNYSQPDQWKPFVETLLARVRSLPGVESAGAANFPLLIGFWGFHTSLKVNGVAMPRVDLMTVTPGYFQTLGIPLLQGRRFSSEGAVESASPPGIVPNVRPNAPPAKGPRPSSAPLPVIVNRMFARTAWGNGNPLGHMFKIPPFTVRVVGVVANTRDESLSIGIRPTAYAPLYQVPFDGLALAVHSSVPPSSLVRPVEKQIWSVNSNLAISRVRTMSELIAENEAGSRFRTLLLGIFAFLGLALAVVGVYGVSSYAVTQRTHEFGLRMALGAQRGDVLRLVLAEGAGIAAVGVAAGLALTLVLAGLLRGMLFGVTAMDPATLVITTVMIAGAALLACYLPARRAAKVDPAVALRWE